jgi:hypothetical protein
MKTIQSLNFYRIKQKDEDIEASITQKKTLAAVDLLSDLQAQFETVRVFQN